MESTSTTSARMDTEAIEQLKAAFDARPEGKNLVVQFFQESAHERTKAVRKLHAAGIAGDAADGLAFEYCYNVELAAFPSPKDWQVFDWLLDSPSAAAGLTAPAEGAFDFEVGPRRSFSTAWCTNCLSILQSASDQLGRAIPRVERSRRYRLSGVAPEAQANICAALHDRMTEEVYATPVTSFEVDTDNIEQVYTVKLMERGEAALAEENEAKGLAMDEADIKYYTSIFKELGRDPTSVELFDISQSNSEHSRHWFFGGIMDIDGVKKDGNLFQMVKDTLPEGTNSTIAFKDNSSAITCQPVANGSFKVVAPSQPGHSSELATVEQQLDVCFTAETHNFPTGVCPYAGAETGIGGRLRDQNSTGKASLVGCGTAGYCVGNLKIPGYEMPWEDAEALYPATLAPPLQIIIDASNGASDYGNKFGEPIVNGFCRSFGLGLGEGDTKERREWVKPIMFTGGMGSMLSMHREKGKAAAGMKIVKLGGPCYRIGMGGGAASSMVQGDNKAELDFNAVQRGDAEMEQKMNRVVKACAEMGERNPIVQIHDQGAGGNCNVLKEVVEDGPGTGGLINLREITRNDPSLSACEIWGAEYQENDVILVSPDDVDTIKDLCARERCPMCVVGTVTDDGKIVVIDTEASDELQKKPVDLPLDKILGKLPPKTFTDTTKESLGQLPAVVVPPELTLKEALCNGVLRLLAVGSKRFLTTKVDRSVSGLVAQQQCVGPLHIPLCGYACYATSHLDVRGAGTAIGEQPIKGLIDPAAMARMSVAEGLTNLVFCGGLTNSGLPGEPLDHIKAEGNWMWAAKLAGEASAMWSACEAMRDVMLALKVSVDGGKDSLSMAAKVPSGEGLETVKAPGALTISLYCTTEDVNLCVTPDLKEPSSKLLLVPLGEPGKYPLGASALAQTLGMVGNADECPDCRGEQVAKLKAAFGVTQALIREGRIRAGQDISDGGLITAVLEMAFAGNKGVALDLATAFPEGSTLPVLFHESLGLVLEVAPGDVELIQAAYAAAAVSALLIGEVSPGSEVTVLGCDGSEALSCPMPELRDVWEDTSFRLEERQADLGCVAAERDGLQTRTGADWQVPFAGQIQRPVAMGGGPRVCILREEGTNGDREMAAAFHMAGCTAVDVTMADLIKGDITLESFRGIAFCGGFSYADVLDAGTGWAAAIRFNDTVSTQFSHFRARADTFSLGVCNGCQLMARLGWVQGWEPRAACPGTKVRFTTNKSGRFESRFSTVAIGKSAASAVLLKGMEGATLGIWVAHGEGHASFASSDPAATARESVAKGLVPITYVDDKGASTEAYPFNPNGAPQGIAALCSEDGRHLCIMPHPERCTLGWQLPWMPPNVRAELHNAQKPQGFVAGSQPWSPSSTALHSQALVAPWFKLFQNAAKWCSAQDEALAAPASESGCLRCC